MWYIDGGCLLEIDPLRALIIWTNHEQTVVHATEFCIASTIIPNDPNSWMH
jgi:hypothetical protein